MLLSLQRNNTRINNNNGSGAECPHPFGQGYTVWVRCGRARSVRAGYGLVGSGGRGEIRLDLLRFVAVCSGGRGSACCIMLRRVPVWLVKAVGVTLGEV